MSSLTEYARRRHPRFPHAGSVTGSGSYAVVSCTGYTVSLWETEAEALSVAAMLDLSGCGHHCGRRHGVSDLGRRWAA